MNIVQKILTWVFIVATLAVGFKAYGEDIEMEDPLTPYNLPPLHRDYITMAQECFILAYAMQNEDVYNKSNQLAYSIYEAYEVPPHIRKQTSEYDMKILKMLYEERERSAEEAWEVCKKVFLSEEKSSI